MRAHECMALFSVAAALFLGFRTAAAAANMMDQCSTDFQKVTTCLPFVTAKADVPSKACCDSAEEIKESRPACLCYIIEAIRNGTSPEVKSMGIQEERLLQLPSACRLTNASIAECPKLLNIPPGSPDYAIFTNSTASPYRSARRAGTVGGASVAGRSSGGSNKHGPSWIPFIATSIFFYPLLKFY